jgi:hypothetical protein
MITFEQGQRVVTPHGPGAVAYVRMAAPDYARPEAYSVVLDSQRNRPGYAGSMYSAKDVHAEPERAP